MGESIMGKRILIILLTLFLMLPAASYAKSADILLIINNNKITNGAKPIIINSSTYIPLRNFFENVQFTVGYVPINKTATAWYNRGAIKISFTIDSNMVEVTSTKINGATTYVKISGEPIIQNGSVYVPLRAFGELLGGSVSYDSVYRAVFFNASDDQIKNSLYPRVGLTVDEQPIVDVSQSTEKKPLTAKEAAMLMDRVGIVYTYDINRNPIASGSGFVINGGMFITNHHVVEGSSGMLVKLDGTVYDTKGWWWFDNPTTDLHGTYLTTEYSEKGLPIGAMPTKSLPYNTDLPEVGDKVYAIGSPLGLENTISEGIVSGIREDTNTILIQHTADTDHGSSGGILLNEFGEVIGVTSSGVDGTNLDFAIPIQYVINEIQKLNG